MLKVLRVSVVIGMLVVLMAYAGYAVKSGGTLKVGMAGGFDVLDPQKTTLSNYDSTMRYTVFQTLVNVLPGTDELGPQLATSWEWIDASTLEFKLREGVVFHSGEPFTSSDVVFSIERIKNPDTGSQYASAAGPIVKVEALGDYTVRFYYSGPIAKGAALWAFPYMQILSEKDIATIDTHPIGTGPFEFVEWTPGISWTLKRFENYAEKGLPLLDRIEFVAIPDSESRLINLQTGAVDMLGPGALPYKDMERVAKDPTLDMLGGVGGGFQCLIYNTASTGPIGNPLIRQAVSYAIDRLEYVDNVVFTAGTASVGLFSPTNPFYSRLLDSTYSLHRNLDMTAKLLKQAGFPGGKGLKLEIIGISGTTHGDLCQILQQNLKEVGVELTVTILDVGGWIHRLLAGDYEICANGYEEGMIGDPNIILAGDSIGPGYNVAQYYAQDYVDIAAKALVTPDSDERKALYDRLQEIVARDMPFTIICQMTFVVTVRSDVKGYVQGPMRVPYYKNVCLDR